MMMTPHDSLPSEFQDLEPFVARWAHETEYLRNSARLSSSMDEIREFYSAILPRVGDALKYLDRFDLDDMPPNEQTLMNLCLALIEIGNAVDYYNQPEVKTGAGGAGFDHHTRIVKEKLTFLPDRCVRTTP